MQQNINLDISDLHIDEDGVRNFFWPVSYKQRQDFCDELTKHYVDAVNLYSEERDFAPYAFFIKYFVTEAVAVFNTDIIKENLSKHTRRPPNTKQYRLWSSMLFDNAPAPPPFLKKLKKSATKGVKKKWNIIGKMKKVYSFVRIKKGGLTVGNLKLKPLTKSVLENDILATQRSDLIQKHAAQEKKDVVFCRSDRWFKEVEDNHLKDFIYGKNVKIENVVIQAVEQLYKKNNLDFDNLSKEYLSNILTEGSACLRVHYQRLLENIDDLPHNVWTGSAGNTWDGLLRYASFKTHNGISCGHDHGAGLGHVNNPMMGLNELWGCKSFVCLNKNQAIEMQKNRQNWFKVGDYEVELEGFEEQNRYKTFKKFQKNDFQIKTVVVLATLYAGDRVWMGPCAPDVVHIDWQARVITHLKKQGYNVILKIHPETPVLPPKKIADLGAEIRTDRLEDMLDECDAVLFDSLYTSVFRSIIVTNIPMIMVDFYDHPWTNTAMSLLKKRAGFVKANFDENNRCQISWSYFDKELKRSSQKMNNTEFFDYYYA